MSTHPRGASGIATALLLAVPLAAGVGLAVWGLAHSPLESAAAVEPIIASVESAERTDSIRATATYVEADAFAVTTQSTGTMTGLDIVVGQSVENGTVAMEVDGMPVVAYVADAPLFRDVTRGLEGADVATAQQLLHDLGYLDAVDGKAGWATERAIEAFNKDHGYGDTNTVLTTASLLWVPAGSGAPTAVSVRVGAALSPGLELYATTAGTASFTLNLEPAGADRTVTLDDLVIDLPAGMTRITNLESVAALRERLGEQASIAVSVSLAEPRTVGTVPATAIVRGADGTMCFYTGLDGEPVTVAAESGLLGLVDVDADLIGKSVLVNPGEMKDDRTCGS